MYCENYKTLKEIMEDPNKYKDSPCSWTERLHIVNIFLTTNFYLPSFLEMGKLNLKFIQNCKKKLSNNLEKEEQS